MAVASAPTGIASALQESLVDLIDLSLQAKHFHWSVTGPLFRSVHLELDDITASARTASDAVAERLATLGVAPDGQAATIAKSTSLPAPGTGWHRDADVVRAMCDGLTAVAERLETRAGEAGESDLVTQDLLVGIAGTLQKHAWMLRAQTE